MVLTNDDGVTPRPDLPEIPEAAFRAAEIGIGLGDGRQPGSCDFCNRRPHAQCPQHDATGALDAALPHLIPVVLEWAAGRMDAEAAAQALDGHGTAWADCLRASPHTRHPGNCLTPPEYLRQLGQRVKEGTGQ